MKKVLLQSKAFCLLLIVALLFCMAPQFAFTAYADESTDFTSNVGVKTGPVEDGYTYYAYVHDPDNPNADPYGYVTVESKADLYTLIVPYGTQEVTLDFGETETISYNYTEDGTFLEGSYPDPTVGETTTTKKVDSNNDGIPDYIRVQTPYDSAWNSTLLYAITFKYGDVIGQEKIGEVYEMLVAKAAKLMESDANATFKVGDWFIFDQARDGREVNPHYIQSVKEYFDQGIDGLGSSDYQYTNYAKAILAITALGYDARTFADF
ncbi:MAG: hypothetical protein VZR08_05290, partial [Anaerovoracaceae bacterium]|nr:hypothetical protein [Anaerovoracaceae bacterium]